MIDGDRGLEESPAFCAYQERLRETWPANPELAEKHGVAAGNGQIETTDMTESQTGETEALNTEMGRRAFCVAAGATLALGAGAGAASAQTTLNRDSDYVHNPTLSGPVTVAEHDSEAFDSPLQYINDNGEQATLADAGGVLATTADDEPNNPLTLRADRIDAAEYRAFPRGETYTDADGDEQDVSAIDAQHWTLDESGTAGSLTVETTSAASGADALHVATSGQTSGDVAAATFSDFTIDSGEPRKRLQLVATIDTLESATNVYVRVRDSGGTTVESWIDTNADSTAAGTIATGTEAGVIYQAQLGDLGSDLSTIEELEISVEDGNADVTFAALNLEKESEWAFGTREFLNADDEIETETIEETSGEFSITGLDSLDSTLSSATIVDLTASVDFEAGGIDADGTTEHEWSDAERYDQDYRLDDLVGWELPSVYDLSYGTLSFRDTVKFPSSRYLEVSYATGLDELPSLSDDRDSWTGATGTYENGSLGDEITLSADVSGGQTIGWYADVLVNEQERNDAESAGALGGGASGTAGGWLSGPRGIITSALVTIGAYLAYAANLIPGVGE